MMKNSSWLLGLLTLVVFTGCDWCKKCKECDAPKTEQTATDAAKPVEAAATAVVAVENKEQFENEVLKSDKLVIVDFYADFCSVCKDMKPVFEEVANNMKEKCKFVTVCKEKAEDVFATQNLQGVPTFIIFKDGKEQDRVAGAISKEDLSKKIEESLEDHE